MNAKIDIITPSGKSLEGFPWTINTFMNNPESNDIFMDCLQMLKLVTLHKGDRIVIEIL